MTINLQAGTQNSLQKEKNLRINLQTGTQNSLKKEKKIENQFENQFADWNSKLSLEREEKLRINLQGGTQNFLQKEKKIENQFAGWNSTLLETATDLLLDTPARLLGNISFVDDSQDFLFDNF